MWLRKQRKNQIAPQVVCQENDLALSPHFSCGVDLVVSVGLWMMQRGGA
jgi:hypothetical protein